MKTRYTFVSNSSSSSFCIFGVEITEADYDVLERAETSLSLHNETGESGDFLAGMEPDEIGPDETLNQFKQRIVDELKKYDINVDIKDVSYILDEEMD